MNVNYWTCLDWGNMCTYVCLYNVVCMCVCVCVCVCMCFGVPVRKVQCGTNLMLSYCFHMCSVVLIMG